VEVEAAVPGKHAEHQLVALWSSLRVHRYPLAIRRCRSLQEPKVGAAQRSERCQQRFRLIPVVPKTVNPQVRVVTKQWWLVLADRPSIAGRHDHLGVNHMAEQLEHRPLLRRGPPAQVRTGFLEKGM